MSLASDFIKKLTSPAGGMKVSPSNFNSQPQRSMSTQLFGAKPSTPVVPSNTGATAQAPTTIKPPAVTPAKSSNTSGLPASGQQYASMLAGGGNNNTGSGTVPTSTGSSDGGMDDYLKYLSSVFNPDQLTAAKTNVEGLNKRLADIQNEEESKSLAARREQGTILDSSGGTRAGAQDAATVAGRRSNSELVDLAVRESAAARSAGVAQDNYNTYLNAGKSLYDARTEQQKYADSRKDKADAKTAPFELSEGQARYEYDPKTGQYKMTAARAKTYEPKSVGNSQLGELLSVAEAKALGVPFGTTKGQAVGKRSLSSEEEKASISANSALGALANLESELSDGQGGFNRKRLINLGFGKVAAYSREVKDVISRIRTGAAMTPSEESFYGKQIPRAVDNDATIRAKINQLSAFYAGIAGSPVYIKYPDGTGFEATDMYDPSTRQAVREAITNGANVIKY